jgi:phosphoglycerate dehydrogenase-like enzyme
LPPSRPPRFNKQAFELQGKVLGIVGGAGRIGCEVHVHAPGAAASLPLNND